MALTRCANTSNYRCNLILCTYVHKSESQKKNALVPEMADAGEQLFNTKLHFIVIT